MDTYLEALQEADSYIERVYYEVNGMVEDIRVGKVSLYHSKLVMLSEGIEWLIEVFRLTESIQIEKINKIDLSKFLSDIVEAMQHEDVILISDLLYFEFLGILQEWQENLKINLRYYRKEEG